MIVIEFLVFVITSGLFFSEKFRHHIWAVVIAGVVATGSSLLFAYDFGVKLAGHAKEPPVITKIVKQTVIKTVAPSTPAEAAGKPHKCDSFYPSDALKHGEEGVTALRFTVLTDGTVGGVKVTTPSGSEALDEAAVKCVTDWHYRPAIKDGQLAEAGRHATIRWALPQDAEAKPEAKSRPQDEDKPDETATVQPTPEQQSESRRHWYDPTSWFSSEPEKADKPEKPKT